MIKRMVSFACLGLLLTATLGCSGAAEVSGAVDYEGKPVEHGKIRFLPLDDKGELDAKAMIVGVDISKGKYKAADVPMGKKQVVIFARELAGEAAGPAAKDKTGQKQPADSLIPPEATKDLKVDITQPRQTLDFHLKKPSEKPTEAAANPGKK
ncbi:MAG TPA: hypothetical protein VG099_06740 [Gemmataceae bacterium]|jgi:hypothetical protein|nr:hypothetical protein [Gemmataceae bacterium]